MNKEVKVMNRIDFRAMKYFNMYNLRYRKKFIYLYIVLIVVCVAAAIGSVFLQDPPNYVLTVAFGLFAVYLVYQTVSLEKILDRNIANYFYNKRPIEQIMTINEESITIASAKDPSQANTYDWLQVTLIHEIPQFFYLYMGKQPVIIDKDPNALLEGTYQDLLDIVMSKASGKPYKKIDKELVKKPITYVHQEFVEEEQAAKEATVEEVKTVEDVADLESVDPREEAYEERAKESEEEKK